MNVPRSSAAKRSICAVSAELLHLRPARSRPAGGYQQQLLLVDGGGELVPDDQRHVVGPLQVIDDRAALARFSIDRFITEI